MAYFLDALAVELQPFYVIIAVVNVVEFQQLPHLRALILQDVFAVSVSDLADAVSPSRFHSHLLENFHFLQLVFFQSFLVVGLDDDFVFLFVLC